MNGELKNIRLRKQILAVDRQESSKTPSNSNLLMKSVKSKFRKEFWTKYFIQFGGVLGISIFCLVKWIASDNIGITNPYFWILCVALFGLLIYLPMSLISETNRIEVCENEINVYIIITKSQNKVQYSDILRFSTTKIRSWKGPYKSDGYYQLEIELKEGKSLLLTEDQYENYKELKSSIYQNAPI